MKFPVFDFHCDTALNLLGKDMNGHGSLRRNDLHIDLERAAVNGGYAQCFSCFTTPFMEKWGGVSPVTVFERELAVILAEMEKNADLIRQAFSTRDILQNQENGLMSGILTLEGTAGINYDAARLEELYRTGFRVVSLGWNEQNPLTGSHRTGGGLTDQGREFVWEAQRLGYLVDVSHISDEGFWDLIKITEGPVIATHSNSRSVWGVSRNLTDDMFRAICETDGVAGFNMCAEFIGEKPTLDHACDHILHFLELDPSGTHIALGGDLDGIENMPEGFHGVQSFPAFAEALMARGVEEKTVHNIFWNNALGVMDRAVRNHQK
ncbi:MAG: membrane dipeptidase [Ruminococcaceae bacterium]|nr:membrane dipeptidase [Oscillospiraceae bacterium]